MVTPDVERTGTPDFIPEGQEHLFVRPRSSDGEKRDFIPDGQPAAPIEEPIEEPKPARRGTRG